MPDEPIVPEVPSKTVETTTTKTVAAPSPVSTYFDDSSRFWMTMAAMLSFDFLIGALLYKDKLTAEMITLIIGLVGGWLGASWSYSFGSSSGSKAKDLISAQKNP